MLAEVLGLVLRDEVMQRANHIWEETIVLAGDRVRDHAIFVSLQMGIIDVECGEIVQSQATDLGDVVFVCCRQAGGRQRRRG